MNFSTMVNIIHTLGGFRDSLISIIFIAVLFSPNGWLDRVDIFTIGKRVPSKTNARA